MKIRFWIVALTAVSASAARADAPPALAPSLAQLEIAETQGSARASDELAVFVTPSGEPGELDVSQPGGLQTRIKLRLITHGAPAVAFNVERVGADHASFAAKGEIALPPAGKKVLLARVPRPTGAVELWLTLAPK